MIYAVGCLTLALGDVLGLVAGLSLAYFGIVHQWPWE